MGGLGANRDSGPSTAAQVVALIENQISSGRLAPGDRLEPVRALATSLGLAANTVAAAYRTLGERGYVVGQGRRGTFVTTRPPVAMAPIGVDPAPEGLTDLATGNPDPALLPDLGPSLARVASHLDPSGAGPVLYGAPAVDPDLAATLAQDLAADGIEAAHLSVVGGALDGLERVLGAHLRPGDQVALEDPGYPAVAELVRAMGLRPMPVAMDHLGPDPDALSRALGRGIDALIITPRAQNPTGAALDRPRADELARRLEPFPEVVVVEDDHAGLVAGQPYHHLAAGRDRWATVRSVAKSLGPDLRLASLAGDPTTVARVAGRQALGTGWVSHILQRLVHELLGSAEVRLGLERVAGVYAQRQRALAAILGEAGHRVTAHSGLNLWVPVDDEAEVVAAMQGRGYAIRAGARFRHQAPPGVRISTAGADLAILTAAGADLVEVLAGRSGAARSRSV